jgi:hypothetical protein
MRVAAVLTLVVMLNFAGAARQLAAQGDGLNLNLRNLTQEHLYALKDSIVLEFEIINSSSAPVGVFAKLGSQLDPGDRIARRVASHVLKSRDSIAPPLPAHSCRSATKGSTCVALRAGM